jgi:FKBP12-rapamycin complex-associated protein
MNFTALTKAASSPHAPSGLSGGAAPLLPSAGHAASAGTGSCSSASAVAASGAAGGSASAGPAASARRTRHQSAHPSASLLAAGGGSELLNERVLGYVVSAMRGFFRSIALGSSDSLQDLLRLLTLWFRYGAEPRVESTLLNGFDAVEIDMWLLVLPQIIARISSPSPRVRACVHKLLLRVGRRHAQNQRQGGASEAAPT